MSPHTLYYDDNKCVNNLYGYDNSEASTYIVFEHQETVIKVEEVEQIFED